MKKNLESGLYKSYILHGKLETGDHYVNIEQFNNNIVYNDPSGETVNDMFKTFIVDLENVEFIKHNCKSDMLQYNSGLCELFSVKFAFYRQRLAITAGYYGIDIVKDGFDKRFFRLFRNGLLESAFSKMENEKGTILKSFSNSYLEERINILKEQEENLLGINEMFSISKISEILLEDVQKSRKLIYELSDSENPFKPSIEDIASAINVDKTTNEKIKAFINIINNDPQLLFIKNDEDLAFEFLNEKLSEYSLSKEDF